MSSNLLSRSLFAWKEFSFFFFFFFEKDFLNKSLRDETQPVGKSIEAEAILPTAWHAAGWEGTGSPGCWLNSSKTEERSITKMNLAQRVSHSRLTTWSYCRTRCWLKLLRIQQFLNTDFICSVRFHSFNMSMKHFGRGVLINFYSAFQCWF